MTGQAWNLDALSPEDRSSRWEVLFDWVGWLVERYELAEQVPSCWWRHGALVEELNALELSWSAAYESADCDHNAALAWHEDFAKCRERLAEWDRAGCAGGPHRHVEHLGFDVDDESVNVAQEQSSQWRRLGPELRIKADEAVTDDQEAQDLFKEHGAC